MLEVLSELLVMLSYCGEERGLTGVTLRKFLFILSFGFVCTRAVVCAQRELLLAPRPLLAAPESYNKTFSAYKDLRGDVLNLMGQARSHLWLVTDNLTDGDIASALYLAQYRKVDVKVLLGRKNARTYMSRLSFLKSNKISVFIKPNNFAYSMPSGILIDGRLFALNTNLDSSYQGGEFSVKLKRHSDALDFVKGFRRALGKSIPANPLPMPLVGRPSFRGGNVRYYGGENDGSYNYDVSNTASRKPPEHVTKTLPKVPLYKAKEPLSSSNPSGSFGKKTEDSEPKKSISE